MKSIDLLLPLALLLVWTGSLPGQRTLVVDASGQTGAFTSIGAAVLVAAPKDVIHVKAGTYAERLRINGKSVSILGIAPRADQVVLAGLSGGPALRIENHPAGELSRFSRISIRSGLDLSIETQTTQGDILFDSLVADGRCLFDGHVGVLSLAGCTLRRVGAVGVKATNVEDLLLHDCDLIPSRPSIQVPGYGSSLEVEGGHLAVSACRIAGQAGADMWFGGVWPGMPAVTLTATEARISGRPSDLIVGGDGVLSGIRTSLGGSGIRNHSSTLIYSGVTVRGGVGTLSRQRVQAPAFLGPATLQQPAMPVSRVRAAAPGSVAAFQRGQLHTVEVFAAPSAWSITLIAVEYRAPFQTPWGRGLYDLGEPAWFVPVAHDAQGAGSFSVDLRGLPASFAGATALMQTFAFDPQNRPSLSGPRLGVIGY